MEEAFPDAAPQRASFNEEKRALVEAEEAPKEQGGDLPGWGDWGGLGAKPSKRKALEREEAEAARLEVTSWPNASVT